MVLFDPGRGRDGYVFARLWDTSEYAHAPHLEGWTDLLRDRRAHRSAPWVEITDVDLDVQVRRVNTRFFPLNPTPYTVLFYG